MKAISFIEKPSVIRRILKHLDLWEDPRPPPKPLKLVCEPCTDYLPWKDNVLKIEVWMSFQRSGFSGVVRLDVVLSVKFCRKGMFDQACFVQYGQF